MEEKKQHTALTIDRAAFLLLRVKKAFKKKKLQRKERERAQLAATQAEQRASCAGLEGASRGGGRLPGGRPPPLLRSRTLPAIVVPGVNILQAQIDARYRQEEGGRFGGLTTRHHSARVSFSTDDTSAALDYRRKSAVSRLCGTGSYGPERNTDGTVLLSPQSGFSEDTSANEVPAPHVVAARAYRMSNASSSGTALYRLAKLLNQGSTKSNQVVAEDAGGGTRRLSWERRDFNNGRLPRSSSIDSMVEAVWAEGAPEKRQSLRPDRPLTLVSPSVGRRMKGQRGVNGAVETILKTPMTEATKKPPAGLHLGLKKVDFLTSRKDKSSDMLALSQPPSVVAPKAAAILHIPIKENCEPVFYRSKNGGGGTISERVSTRTAEMVERHQSCWFPAPSLNPDGEDDRVISNKTSGRGHFQHQAFETFQRTSLRLSITSSSKRKYNSQLWPSAFSSTSKLPILENEMELASVAPPNAALPPPGHKPSKKQAKLMQQHLDRLARVNIHLHALFAAIEHGHLEKARTILESTDVDVNTVNSDGLSPLDVAVLSNNRPLAKMLVSFGAQEGNQFSSVDMLGSHLKQLLGEAELRLQELGGLLDEPCGIPPNTRASFSSIIGSAYPTSAVTGCAGGDTDKQAVAWGRRVKALRRMVLGFAQARPPDSPGLVAVDITASSSVAVRLQEPTTSDSPITTKFKVQWSTRADFSPITGEQEILDVGKPFCIIELTQGRRYFFRSACGNLKGYGTFLTSSPASLVPSTWREVDQKEGRFDGRLKQLEQLVNEMRTVRPGSELLETPGPQRRAQRKKTTIKQLFTAASKFQKNLRRGIYLACILYHEDKVLVTNEDFLPVIEIDETFPSCIHTDHHWLMKVACTWDDTKSLRSDMEKNASSTVHFRTKLLSAALQMQSALCLQDLGQLYYKPLRDAQGTVVLSTINYVKTPKSVSVLNSRWLPLNKVYKKVGLSDDHSVGEVLMASIQEQINYHQVSQLKLSKGLYLAYLKMQSSVDLIQVVVPAKSPNMLPHCKVRENPHVSAEEWEYLKQQHIPDVCDVSTEQQRTFLDLITSAAKRLFNYMDTSIEDAVTHRLYDTEIIDLTDEVSFIVICPSAEFSCAVPGQREILLQRGDLLSLPIQVFEMIHLTTYQSPIIQRYSRLSCLLELDSVMANHLHREAFSSSELAVAKDRLNKLQDLQSKLNGIWKGVRWLMDVISFARDRGNNGISLKYILDKQSDNMSMKRSLLQLPTSCDGKIVKSTPGRGSWPGPGASVNPLGPPSCLMTEFSKSEQQLCKNGSASTVSGINSGGIPDVSDTTGSQYLSATSDTTESRKNSDSSSYVAFFSEHLPPSRSEDMLYSNQLPPGGGGGGSSNHRGRASTVTSVSATTSPLLNVRPLYSGSLVSVNTLNTTESLHSLSSDSETSCPITAASGGGGSSSRKNNRPKIGPSRSMTNVKQNLKGGSKHLNVAVDPLTVGVTNLDKNSNQSKSLSNLKTVTELDVESVTKPMYLKSSSRENQISDPVFKVPYGGGESTTASSSGSKSTADSPIPGILQVFAAYDTGLASGTSLKLHVTPRTTAREVVDLVVKQLNMAVVLKGKDGPIYTADKLKNFCLVAVIGARERCLRDDFKPLQLQNPWKKGRLYVRQKQDVLAALEHSSKHSAFI